MENPRSEDPLILRWRDHVLDCRPESGRSHVMGILNVTPDSFSDGGLFFDVDAAVRRADVMIEEGAAIIDVGGESTRPRGSVYGEGASAVDADEERSRVVPVIEAVARRHPEVVISVDTYKSDVAEAALDAGASMINDVTGLRYDPRIADVAARYGVPLVVMHSVGDPGSMPHHVAYRDVVQSVVAALRHAVQEARECGAGQVIVDPGFGFGKSVQENLRLIARIDRLKPLECPILVGLSRKSTIGAVLDRDGEPAPVEERLFGTLGATAVAHMRGARLFRTHDVGPTVDLLRVVEAVERSGGPAVTL